jgi:di/tricarboxylate transporter
MLRLAGKNHLRILVAILLPAVVSIGRRIDVRPSKLLIPMAFVSLLGGKMTLIGTPPNILATSIMESCVSPGPWWQPGRLHAALLAWPGPQ